MPRLWNDTIETHRQAVRDATLDAAAALIAEKGLAGTTMSAVAERTGIGRATLYKYFPDVEAVVSAWHERQVHQHLETLGALHAEHADPGARLAAMLEAYALAVNEASGHADWALAGLLHQGAHVAEAEVHLRHMMGAQMQEAAASGAVRRDVPADELVSYALTALSAASRLPSKTAVKRLVAVTLSGLRPDR